MSIINDIKILSGKKKAPGQDAERSRFASKKVLVVEDDVAMANILEDKLKNEGFSVSKAANGEEGLKIAQTVDPNAILLDLMMPVMNGQTMLHRLRQLPKFKTLPVVVLTNAGDIENSQEAHLQDAHFLIKSNVTLAEIVRTIKELL